MSTPAPESGPGNMATFNILHGFTEALVRGMRSSFLADADYHHMTQCETLDDVRLNLSETDYGDALADMNTLIPTGLQKAAVEKLVTEFQYLRTQAIEPLSTFLDFITYEYMIENVMLLLKGTLSGRDINELIAQCHPLGMFKESTMRSIPTFESTPRGYQDLYQTVLVDTPVGPYFCQFLQETAGRGEGSSNVLEEVEIEIIKSSLIKYWIEDFAKFVDALGGETATIMGDLLKVRADTNAINITLNSFGTPLNEPAMRASDRKRLYPALGHLYPAGTSMLADVGDEDELGRVLELFPQYSSIWNIHAAGGSDGKSIDDAFYERDVQMLELAFEGQMHFGAFYAYVKLKEQEIRNLVWISECILQQQKDEIHKFVPVFSFNAPWRAGSKRQGGR